MPNKLTSLTGFGEGDPKPEKGNANWALGGSHAPSRNWGAHKDKTGKNAKSSALHKKMGKKDSYQPDQMYSDAAMKRFSAKRKRLGHAD